MHQVCGDAFVISQRLMLPEDLSLQVWQESLMYRKKEEATGLLSEKLCMWEEWSNESLSLRRRQESL